MMSSLTDHESCDAFQGSSASNRYLKKTHFFFHSASILFSIILDQTKNKIIGDLNRNSCGYAYDMYAIINARLIPGPDIVARQGIYQTLSFAFSFYVVEPDL